MVVSDRIAVMNAGRLAQVAEPAEIYERPKSRWVADFLGDVTLIEGRLNADGTLATRLGPLRVAQAEGASAGDKGWLALRPEKLRLNRERPDGEGVNAASGLITEIGYRGDVSVYKIRLADRSMMKVTRANTGVRSEPGLSIQDVVWVSWPHDAGILLRE